MNLQNKKLKIYSGFSRKNPRGVLISPGPGKIFTPFVFHVFDDCAEVIYIRFSFNVQISGTPQDSGISLQTVLELGPTVPLFGVCMGLQCIGEAFGGNFLVPINDFISYLSSLMKDYTR